MILILNLKKMMMIILILNLKKMMGLNHPIRKDRGTKVVMIQIWRSLG